MIAVAPLGGNPVTVIELTSRVPVVVINGFRSSTIVPPGCVVSSATLISGAQLAPHVAVKLTALVATPHPPIVTLTGPIPIAPAGTVIVSVVVVLAVIDATAPFTLTVWSAGVAVKFVPVIVTVDPTTPLVGVNEVIVGGFGQSMAKLFELVAGPHPFTVTVMGPVPLVPLGTLITMVDTVLEVTVASIPFTCTTLFAGVVLKLVPLIVTTVPIVPEEGLKEVIAGVGPQVTVKALALVAVAAPTITVIVPVVAPAGTVVVMPTVLLAVTTAVVPLNRTVLLAGVVLKLVPVIVTVVPVGPLEGVKPVTVGVAGVPTVKVGVKTPVKHFSRTNIGPETALVGTFVVMVVGVTELIIAWRLGAKRTSRSAGSVPKFVPVMTTSVPTGPKVGEIEVTVGWASKPTNSFTINACIVLLLRLLLQGPKLA